MSTNILISACYVFSFCVYHFFEIYLQKSLGFMKSFILNIVIIIAVIVFSILFHVVTYHPSHANVVQKKIEIIKENKIRTLDHDLSLKDKNELHLKYAVQNGLKKTYRTDKEFLLAIDSLRYKNELVYISDKKNYIVDDLTHSHPYLTKDARDLLSEIGDRFNRKQIENHMKPYKMLVTSLLRTERSQISLRKQNVNATRETTAHLYGTTFDISRKKFVKKNFFGKAEGCNQASKYEKLLENVLKELRDEGRCVVVKENKQACFHITVAE